MTNKIDFLPYVDGTPTDGQRRLSWIRNGDLLNGSDTKYGNQGNLNAFGVELQKNIVFLAENIGTLEDLSSITYEELERIKEILGEAGEGSVVDQVNKNTADIKLIQETVSALKEQGDGQVEKLDDAITLLGTPSPGNGTNSVFTDLLYIKTRIGNREGEDINGIPSVTNPATGIIAQVLDQGIAINKNKEDIQALSEKLDNSDLTGIHTTLDGLRLELGPKPAEGTLAIYPRLDKIEATDVATNDRIDEIETKIGTGNIIDKVNQNTNEITDLDHTLNDPATGLVKKVDSLQTDHSGLETGLADTNLRVTSLEATVGLTDESGLRLTVKGLDEIVGLSLGGSDTLVARTAELETQQGNQTTKIQDMEVVLGANATQGLQGSVLELENQMNGDPNASENIDKVGVKNFTFALDAKVNLLGEVQDKLKTIQPYAGKLFAILGDHTTSIKSSDIAARTFVTASENSAIGANGVATISIHPGYIDAKDADVLLVNIGTYDYLFDTKLGTIADADAGYTGEATFYNETFKLLDDLATGSKRVILSLGYRAKGFTGSTVEWPAPNGVNTTYADYTKAATEVAKMFGVPVIDTDNELGVNAKNVTTFAGATGLTAAGIDRFASLIANSLR